MKSLIASLIGLMLSLCTSSEAEQHYSPQELEAAKAKLRTHNRLWTFEAGAVLGRRVDEPRTRGRRAAGTLRTSATRAVVRAPRDPRASRRDLGTGAGQPLGALRASTRVSDGLAVCRRGSRVQPARLEAAAPAGVCRSTPSVASVQKRGSGAGISGLAGCGDAPASRSPLCPCGIRVPGTVPAGGPRLCGYEPRYLGHAASALARPRQRLLSGCGNSYIGPASRRKHSR